MDVFNTSPVPVANPLLLLVDDDEVFCRVLGRALERRGFEVISAHGVTEAKTLLQLIQEKNREQRRSRASRADLRFDGGPDGQVYLLNKYDGIIRLLVP